MKTIALLMLLCIASCTQLPKPVDPAKPSTGVQPSPSPSLSWESSHDERKPWSRTLTELVGRDLSVYLSAKDIETICPKIKSLGSDKQIKAIAEFWLGLFYYESGYNEKSASVDVGNKTNKNTWSIGLGQISQVDQTWCKADRVYSYDELLTAIPNIKLSLAMMKRQITRNQKILLNNSDKDRYWAIILVRNRYQKINEIKERVQKHTGFCQ